MEVYVMASDKIGKFKMGDLRRMITAFVNEQLGEPTDESYQLKTKQGVPIIKAETISKIASRGIAIKRVLNSITSDLAKIDLVLKKIGKEKIEELRAGGEDIKSVRFASTHNDLSVLVTVRGVSCDGRKAPPVKKALGKRQFDKIFDEQTSWALKPAFADRCVALLKSSLGQKFVDDAFTRKTVFSLKSQEELDKFCSSDLDDETKEKLKSFMKPADVAITYPK